MSAPKLIRLTCSITFSGAKLSPCGRYRYDLTREFVEEGNGKFLLFVMLNPSTADASEDDPTIRKCIGFARRWGYSGIAVANLFAFRATDPRDLVGAPAGTDLVGLENHDRLIQLLDRAGAVVAAWGARVDHPRLAPRARVVEGMLRGYQDAGLAVLSLGMTEKGHPKHPLFVPYSVQPGRWPF